MPYIVSKACANRAVALLASGSPPLALDTIRFLTTMQGVFDGGPAITFTSREDEIVFVPPSESAAALSAVVNAVHPGHVKSKLGGDAAPTTPAQGAAAVMRAILAPAQDGRTVSGAFYGPLGQPYATGWD